MNWIEEHPYLTGSIVLAVIVGYFLLSSGSSSSAQVATGTVSTSGASDNSAQLAAQVQMQNNQNTATLAQNAINEKLAEKQVDANTAATANNLAAQVQLQNIYTSGAVAQHSADVSLQIAQAQVGGQVQLATIGAASNEKIAGIQADVENSKTAAALAAQKDIDAAATAQAQIGATAAVTINQQNNTAAVTINQQNRTADIDYTKLITQNNVDLATINAGVETHAIDVQGDVYKAAIDSNTQIGLAQVQQKSTLQTIVANLLGSGQLNKGGEGGSNQVSVLNNLISGNPYAPPTQPSGFSFSIPTPWGSVGAGASL